MSFNPTPAQQVILDTVRDEPNCSIVVDARAGAAKTSTIVLAAQFIPPSRRALAVAFNKKISEELAARLPSHFTCATLNSIGHRAWGNRLGKRLQVDADKMGKILKTMDLPKDDDNEDLFVQTLNLARAAKGAGLVPNTCPFPRPAGLWEDDPRSWEILAEGKGMLDVDDDVIFFARELLTQSIKQAWQGVIDYDDQIYMSTLFGGDYPRFDDVIVDEAQDLSPLNHRQILKLTWKRAIIVGDPFQAIYGFRGADSNSIINLVELLEEAGGLMNWKKLPLSKSFRVPKSISSRQVDHVPDFGSMDFLSEGRVEHWPLPPQNPGQEHWSLHSIPQKGFVLCRNNAPLMRLAFAFIKEKRPVQILGRDIGANIANLLLKITSRTTSIPINKCLEKLEAWKQKEMEKAGDSESKLDIIFDRYDALLVLLEAGGKEDNLASAEFIRDLFSDSKNEYKTTFSSIHRSKGLEEDWVMMLDPDRIPSPQAVKAERRGDPGPMQQELNLRYVGETRSKGTLVLARLEDCVECGE